EKWFLVLSDYEHTEITNIFASVLNESNKGKGEINSTSLENKKQNIKKKNKKYGITKKNVNTDDSDNDAFSKLIEYYKIIKEKNKCMCLMLYPFIQCLSEDDSSCIIFITSISLISYLKTDQITYDYYNQEIKNLHKDASNIVNNHYMTFDYERGLLPMLSFTSLNDALEIDERIYIYDHKNVKQTFNKIRTMCHIEIKEFTGNFRQLDMKKQTEILVKLQSLIKIIKPMNTLAWKRRTYVLYNSDSFYFIIILTYI
ncbi:conserved protein, unknown function, partial [Hepatocystis sp. ex Piliocolobus tephrosceles]